MLQVFWGLLGLGTGWLLGARRARRAELRAAELTRQQVAAEVEQARVVVANMTPLVAELGALRAIVSDLAPMAQELHAADATAGALRDGVSALRDGVSALRENVAALDKQLGRIGREQFKVNTLSEAQQQQIQAAFDQLRDLSTRRESDLAILREQLRAEQSAQRLTVIQQLLPALDGLDEALAAGQRLLDRAAPPAPTALPALTFQQRVSIALGRSELPTVRLNGAEEWRPAAAAWLAGIELVRERLLRVLAAEGVQPIVARGEPFDPHQHIALEAVTAPDGIAPGTVVQEYRRGYRVGERILRAAEVVVAK